MIRIGVIGYGYWGPNLVRNFYAADGARVTMVCDLQESRRTLVTTNYPTITAVASADTILNSTEIDAVLIATPVASHFDLAMQALKSGKHVFVEKPMTQSAAEAAQLIAEAEKRKLTLMVDHTFLYTGAVRRMKELVDDGELGELYYFDSARVNLGLFQTDVNVVWDLAVHDLSILDYLIPNKPVGVACTGIAHISEHPENTAYLTLHFEQNFIAHINVNWLSPVKLRRIMLGGSNKMVLFNDLDPSEKLRVYDKGIDTSSVEDMYKMMALNYRTGDMVAPKIDQTEALSLEADHFIDCIKNGTQPITNGKMGARIVTILESANESLKNNGAYVKLNLD